MTNFQFLDSIDNLTKNTNFPVKLLTEKKVAYDDNSEIQYNLLDRDFPSDVLANLKFVQSELGLTNNNWGLIKYDGKYERIAAYCARIYNFENKLVLEVGSNYEDDNLVSSRVVFDVAFKKSKIQGSADKAFYTVNNFPVVCSPEVGEDGKLKFVKIAINLEEIIVELPLYVNRDVVESVADFEKLWNKGEGHLAAQIPKYKKTHNASKFLRNIIALKQFPKEGVSLLIKNPTWETFEKKDGSGTFQTTKWDVVDSSHPELVVTNNYTYKEKEVNDSYPLRSLSSIRFGVSKNSISKSWGDTGLENCLVLVWFYDLCRKDIMYIPQHIWYILDVEENVFSIPPDFLSSQSEFLDRISDKLIEEMEKISLQNESSLAALMAGESTEISIGEVEVTDILTPTEIDKELEFA